MGEGLFPKSNKAMKKKTLLLFPVIFILTFSAMAQKNDPAFGIAVLDQRLVTPGIIPEVSGSFNIYSDNRTTASIFIEDIGYVYMDKGGILAERSLIDKILGEISIGSSELADPNMRNKLGRITLAAFLVFTDFTVDEDKAVISVRVIATDTGELVYANTLFFIQHQSSFDAETEKEGIRIYEAINRYAKEHVINIHEKVINWD